MLVRIITKFDVKSYLEVRGACSVEHTLQLSIEIFKGKAGMSPKWPKMSHTFYKMQELVDFDSHVSLT